ncbi:MAG: LacI family DNA-binding transcriptional regulator [Phycisphaeraceae bacterium JB051]
MTSIYKIGKDLGVSSVTVSNALNNRKGVGEKTAQRIREYAQKIGYRPSQSARVLSKGRTHTIGICLRSSPRNSRIASILDGLSQAVRPHGYMLQTIFTNGDLEQIREALNQLSEQRVEATIIGNLGYTNQYLELADQLAQLPNVVAFGAVDNLPIDHCMDDVYQGGLLAMQHLYELGHRDIGYIGALPMERQLPGVRNRYTAYRDALNLQKRAFIDEWLIDESQCQLRFNESRVDELIELLANLKRQDKMPTAWFCHNDWIAAQMIRALHQMGLSVPNDVSLIGMDNQAISQISIPTITTFSFDLNQYIGALVDLVFSRLNLQGDSSTSSQDSKSVQRRVIEPQLIIRESTAPLASES